MIDKQFDAVVAFSRLCLLLLVVVAMWFDERGIAALGLLAAGAAYLSQMVSLYGELTDEEAAQAVALGQATREAADASVRPYVVASLALMALSCLLWLVGLISLLF